MNPARHEQVKSLFLAACELDESNRAKFLEDACGGDAALRAEVESLLRHHNPATLIRKGEPGFPARPDDATQTMVLAGAPEAPRFAAGTVLAGRYRITSPLGKGGMGEVYRADDLRLHRQVALKFISPGRSHDAAWLARFLNEARIALTVTHPNVCRVYDLGEAEGDAFLSMEYVDGEDLASLLRRIGRLPQDKVVQIARQLASALMAAHGQGVLHRDLKPANVMIDGRGNVRVTDFGIASLAAGGGERVIAGTPAYMAPETLQGAPATARGDLYSLGLVLYELVTGRRAFPADSMAERREQPSPPAPSTLVDNLDPALERVILHCMQDAPDDRPASAYEVLAELSGGDPLAAALAAGETPAPEVVAAARVRDRERPVWVGAVAGALVVGLFVVAILGGRTCFLSQAGLTLPPAVLDEKARQILRTLTGDPTADGVAHGFVISKEGLAFLQNRGRKPDWRSMLAAGRSPVVVFVYAQEAEKATRWALAFDPRLPETRSAPSRPITIQLDGSGRLLHYLSAVRLPLDGEAAAREPDWATAFAMAGLDLRSMSVSRPRQTPPSYADRCVAWEGPCPARAGERLRVEGASASERITYFHVASPWEVTTAPPEAAPSNRLSWRPEVTGLLFLATLLVAAPLAWRNTQVGSGDRRSARRLALFLLAVSLLNWLVGRTHGGTLNGETASLTVGLRTAVFVAAVMWIYYMALEPSVRRCWPHSLISWSRLLSGRVADPLVGRDAMIGVVFGLGVVLLRQLHSVADATLGLGAFATVLPPDIEAELGLLSGYRFILTQICHAVIAAIGWGVILVMLMLVFRVVFKTPLLGSVAFFVTVTTAIALGSQACGPSAWIVAAVMAIASGLAVLRCGLLTAIVGMFAHQLLIRVPLTADRSAWYAETTAVVALVVLAIAAFGTYTAFTPRFVRR